MPDGRQRRESVGAFDDLSTYSLDDAKVAEAKRMVQKKEKRILVMLPENEVALNELRDWYVELLSEKNWHPMTVFVLRWRTFSMSLAIALLMRLNVQILKAIRKSG